MDIYAENVKTEESKYQVNTINENEEIKDFKIAVDLKIKNEFNENKQIVKQEEYACYDLLKEKFT